MNNDEKNGLTVSQIKTDHKAMRVEVTSNAVRAWAITFVPLLTNDGIEALRATNQGHLMNMATTLAMSTDLMRVCAQDKCEEFDKLPPGTRFFKQDEPPQVDHLSDTQPNLLASTREHARDEPLQFPEMTPPHGQSHFVGRWVQLNGETIPKWFSYPPNNDPFTLPTNASLDLSHWQCRITPTGKTVLTMNDLFQEVSHWRTKKGLECNPMSLKTDHGPIFPEDKNGVHEGCINAKDVLSAQDRAPL